MIRMSLHPVALLVVTVLSAICSNAQGQTYNLGLQANAQQKIALSHAYDACPGILRRQAELIEAGKLTALIILPRAQSRSLDSLHAAFVQKSHIFMADDWFADQTRSLTDLSPIMDMQPINLCFALGHLMEHIDHPPPWDKGPDAVGAFLMQEEARAFLEGWAYALEADRHRLGVKALTETQAARLLVNLRYRFAFFAALRRTNTPRLHYLPDGSFPIDQTNLDAVANGLKHENIADIQ